MPSVGTGEYLWMTSATKTGDGLTLVSSWNTPVRISPYDGEDGESGSSPAMVYRGVYDETKTYYGNQYRLDCVKYGTEYYIARIDAGEFSTPAPPDTSKWNAFGASFESVATQLLLAEEANIAGWIFRNGRLESQETDGDGNPMAYLNGETGEMRLQGTIAHSTGMSVSYGDYDLISLPARTSVLANPIKVGVAKTDIGKKILLTNNSELGGDGVYKIRTFRFGRRVGYLNTYTDNEKLLSILPQETIELTCFEIPAGTTVGGYESEYGGWWKITNRYDRDVPPAVAMGIVTSTTSGATIEGKSVGGTSFSVTRNGTGSGDGLYTITLPSIFANIENPIVQLTGIGYRQGSTSDGPVKATVISWTKSTRQLVVAVSDDDTANGGSFSFVIYSFGGWKYDS